MNLLIKGVTIADPNSKFNGETCDVRVECGTITAIDKILAVQKTDFVFEEQGAVLSPGFFDLNCAIGDPGLETKEDIATGTAAAAAGGFTGIAVMPNTRPVVHSKGEVAYILNRAKNNLVTVYPIGAISYNLEGRELAEMFDMQQAGAVAFADGGRAIADDGFMSRALQYAQGFGGLLFTHAENKAIAGKAQVNESETTVLLGMKGIPALAEEMQISRDIFLAQYHNAALHISNISTAGAMKLIKKAKKDGVKVTCDVAAHQLVFTEDLLNDFDSNYKVKPPLRGKLDIEALITGLNDDTIDAITSQHRPHEIEFKNVEFEIAEFGIITLQTVLPLLLKAGLPLPLIIEKLAIAPRKLLKLNVPKIEVGELANFCVFNVSKDWTFNFITNKSKSTNSPLFNTVLTGMVRLICNNNQYEIYKC